MHGQIQGMIRNGDCARPAAAYIKYYGVFIGDVITRDVSRVTGMMDAV